MLIWLQRPADPAMRRVGEFCHQAGQVLTPVALVAGVRDRFVKLLPGLVVTFQPKARSLVNLPTLFDTHQPTSLGRPRFVLGGHVITVAGVPQWGFDFGDTTGGVFDVPGGQYPNQDIAHPYAQQGTFVVTVRTTWVGTFTVDGLGPFAITGPNIVQTQTVTVPVKEARAVLVG